MKIHAFRNNFPVNVKKIKMKGIVSQIFNNIIKMLCTKSSNSHGKFKRSNSCLKGLLIIFF